MSFEQSRMEVGQKRYSKPWQGTILQKNRTPFFRNLVLKIFFRGQKIGQFEFFQLLKIDSIYIANWPAENGLICNIKKIPYNRQLKCFAKKIQTEVIYLSGFQSIKQFRLPSNRQLKILYFRLIGNYIFRFSV